MEYFGFQLFYLLFLLIIYVMMVKYTLYKDQDKRGSSYASFNSSIPNDVLLDNSTGLLYILQSDGFTWIAHCNIKGSTGATGPTGIRGSKFTCVDKLYMGICVSVNNNNPGSFIGQLKLDISSSTVYEWNGIFWFSINLPDSPAYFICNGNIYVVEGSGQPAPLSVAIDGDLAGDILLDDSTGQLYILQSNGVTWLADCILSGPTGPTGVMGPIGVTGPTGVRRRIL